MSEQKSEVQNLSEPSVATEPLDASPPAANTGQVSEGEPKDYPKDAAADNAEPSPTEERPAR